MHFCTVIHESFSINAKTFPLIFDAGMVTAILGLLQTIFFHSIAKFFYFYSSENLHDAAV